MGTSTTTTSEAQRALGELGVNGCLDGCVQITSPQMCNDVSSALGLTYDSSQNKDTASAAALVCNRCEGCKNKTVRVDDCHGDSARWVCCKGTTATTSTTTTSTTTPTSLTTTTTTTPTTTTTSTTTT